MTERRIEEFWWQEAKRRADRERDLEFWRTYKPKSDLRPWWETEEEYEIWCQERDEELYYRHINDMIVDEYIDEEIMRDNIYNAYHNSVKEALATV